jgi:hypothetical protein
MRLRRVVPLFCLLGSIATHASAQDRWAFVRQSIQAPDEEFSYLTGVAIARTGQVFVALSRPPRIWIYDSTGRRITSFGRLGKGPGEFGQRTNLIGMLGDTLWVADFANYRYNLYSLEGKSLGSLGRGIPRIPGGREQDVLQLRALRPGCIYMSTNGPARDENGMEVDRETFFKVTRASMGAEEAEILDTIFAYDRRHGGTFIRTRDDRTVSLPGPWLDNDKFGMSSDASVIAVARSLPPRDPAHPTYTLTAYGGRKVLWKREVPYTLLRTTDAMVDSTFREWIRSDTSLVARFGGESALRKLFDERFFRPEFLPPVEQVEIGNDTTVWIQRMRLSESAPQTWDIFDRSGKKVGTTELPAQIRVIAVSRNTVWGSEPDEDGNPMVVLYSRQHHSRKL